jgi:hypothetical protein
MIVVDNRTYEANTRLLLSRNQENPRDYIQPRPDFESTIVVLKTIEIGCGDVDT